MDERVDPESGAPAAEDSGDAPVAQRMPLEHELEHASERPDRHAERSDNMLPGRERRRSGIERLFVRLIATGGIVGIGVLLGAILASSKIQGWIIGLVVALVSVILSAVLWSSRQL